MKTLTLFRAFWKTHNKYKKAREMMLIFMTFDEWDFHRKIYYRAKRQERTLGWAIQKRLQEQEEELASYLMDVVNWQKEVIAMEDYIEELEKALKEKTNE